MSFFVRKVMCTLVFTLLSQGALASNEYEAKVCNTNKGIFVINENTVEAIDSKTGQKIIFKITKSNKYGLRAKHTHKSTATYLSINPETARIAVLKHDNLRDVGELKCK